MVSDTTPYAPDLRVAIMKMLAAHAPVRLEGPLHRGTTGVIYRADVDGGDRRLAVKHCTLAREPADAVRRQFEDQKLAWELMPKSARFGIPQPISTAPEEHLLAMEWVEGETIQAALGHIGDMGVLGLQFQEAGQWLGQFHASSMPTRQPFDTSGELLQIELDARRVSGRLARQIVSSNTALLRGLRSEVAGQDVYWTKTHGDYHIDNVIFDFTETKVIDFSSLRDDYNANDLVVFLFYLDRLCLSPRYVHLGLKLGRLKARFIEGYASVLPPPGQRLLAWLLLANSTRYFLRRLSREQGVMMKTYLTATFAAISCFYRHSLNSSEA